MLRNRFFSNVNDLLFHALIYRYIDNEIDLDSLCKLRAYRIKSFAKWLANEARFSLIRMRSVIAVIILYTDSYCRSNYHFLMFNFLQLQ